MSQGHASWRLVYLYRAVRQMAVGVGLLQASAMVSLLTMHWRVWLLRWPWIEWFILVVGWRTAMTTVIAWLVLCACGSMVCTVARRIRLRHRSRVAARQAASIAGTGSRLERVMNYYANPSHDPYGHNDR